MKERSASMYAALHLLRLVRPFGLTQPRLAFMLLLMLCLAPAMLPVVVSAQTVDPQPLDFEDSRIIDDASLDTRTVAVGDMNGDGHFDVVIGNYDGQSVVRFGDGNGNFTHEGNVGAEADQTTALAIADMNGDGGLDVIVANEGAQSRIYFNDGTGNFVEEQPFGTSAESTRSIAVADLNNDGAFDVILGKWAQPNTIYFNSGNGMLGTSVSLDATADPTTSIAVGYLNADNFPDIVVGNAGAPNRVYLSTSAGNYQAGINLADGEDDTRGVAIGDMNGDGAQDIVVGNYNDNGLIHRNNGAGQFNETLLYRFAALDATISVAVGDMDGDGDLDIITGNEAEQNVVHLNNGVAGFQVNRVAFGTSAQANSIAVADLNYDSRLDILVGEGDQVNRLYLNNQARATEADAAVETFFGDEEDTSAVVLADIDNDGDLDIISGNDVQQNAIHINQGNGRYAEAMPFGTAGRTFAIDVGDMNGDTYLDIVVGNAYRQQSGLYLNDGTGNFPGPRLDFGDVDDTEALVVADMDNDGALDIVVANFERPNLIYLNDGNANFGASRAFGTGDDQTFSVAVGDMNNDGALDIVAGNWLSQNMLYLNNGNAAFPFAIPFGTGFDRTLEVAVGDMNGDGLLDIIVGNEEEQSYVYINTGGTDFTQKIPFGTPQASVDALAIGDMDGNRRLDIVVGSWTQQNVVYLNGDSGQFPQQVDFGKGTDNTVSLALGDVNRDGSLDIVTGNEICDDLNEQEADRCGPPYDEEISRQSMVYFGSTKVSAGGHVLPAVTILRPVETQEGGYYSTPEILGDRYIPVQFSLSAGAVPSVGSINAYYSLNGGGDWRPAVSTADTVTTNLATGAVHTFTWDTFASGLFGQSDNVVFRIEAFLQPRYTGVDRTYGYDNQIAGPHLWPNISATGFPFRVRGTQVRVVKEDGTPAPNALVYHLPAGDSLGGELFNTGVGTISRTDEQGYLPGRGALALDDRLLALLPIKSTAAYTLYHTSAVPTVGGLALFTVTNPGVQTLAVSAANPLLLFNLDLSLEWDARQDAFFLAQLAENLQRTSQLLYDWTNGQVALGEVTIYQDKERWEEADIQLYASNRLRPSADRGGVVREETVLDFTVPITLTRGQVRIGPNWNRYGDLETIGDDWPNVLAHELGHYLLFLEDTYLGLDANGLLIPVETCADTPMTDPYEEPSSEFQYDGNNWLDGASCANTLAEMPEWDLITIAYNDLHKPPPENRGPTAVPMAFTKVTVVDGTTTEPPLLIDDTISLSNGGNALANGRAYLVRSNQRIVDLGRPAVGSIEARGARRGDELCLFSATQSVCTPLENSTTPPLTLHPLWQATVTLTPVTTTTLQIQVDLPDGSSDPVSVRIYPNGTYHQEIELISGIPGTLSLPSTATDLLLDVRGGDSGERLITGYSIGAGPGRIRSHGGPGRIRSHGGPVTSGDGTVVLYPPTDLANSLADGTFVALQLATTVPAPPAGLLSIGRAYTLRPSGTIENYGSGSLLFYYLGIDVALSNVPESNLAVYYTDGVTWQRLATTIDFAQNIASAALAGPGTYQLMTSYGIPLAAGWNLVAYPLQESQTPAVALASIADEYTIIAGYDPANATQPWKLYDPAAPAPANNLETLEPGKGYWIYAERATVWRISPTQTLRAANVAVFPFPPARFYGTVRGNSDFVPTAGLPVTVYIGDTFCGEGETKEVAGGVIYLVDVLAAESNVGCGVTDQPVAFFIDSRPFLPNALWRNGQIQVVDLSPASATPFAAGDCNGDQLVDAGDMAALVLEIFDGDGATHTSAPNGSYPGQRTCDANEDSVINAADIACTVLRIFNGPDACRQAVASRATAEIRANVVYLPLIRK